MTAMTHPMIPRTTYTKVAIDEWTAANYPTHQHLAPEVAPLTPDEAIELGNLLAGFADLVGPIPQPAMVLLKMLTGHRDDSARVALDYLRTLSGEWSL